jgi:predicted ribosomally synthesized peptide with SipW-like signal peptide
MKQILFSLAVIGVTSALAVGGSGAFFSDAETSTGNTFTAGTIDLKIDNSSWYNGVFQPDLSWGLSDLAGKLFFNFKDLKPGDWSEDTVSLHVDNNDSWVCANVKLTKNDDNGTNEPELAAGDTQDDPANNWDGELARELHFVFWADDGDNVLETGEKVLLTGNPVDLPQGDGNPGMTFPIVDSTFNAFGTVGQPLAGLETKHIGKAWCFGTLTQTPATQDGSGSLINPGGPQGPGITCDGALVTNISQSDTLIGDVTFSAVQSRNNPSFVCKPVQTSCTELDTWANSVKEFHQGVMNNGGAIAANRSDPAAALGVAESTGTPYDVVIPGTFFSLGFNPDVLLGVGGNITLGFPKFIINGPGPDLRVYEVTGGPSYPDEKVRVEASQDGSSWTLLAASVTRDADVDLGSLGWAKYVRVTDVSDRSQFEPTADGYDLDAVRALNCANELVD